MYVYLGHVYFLREPSSSSVLTKSKFWSPYIYTQTPPVLKSSKKIMLFYKFTGNTEFYNNSLLKIKKNNTWNYDTDNKYSTYTNMSMYLRLNKYKDYKV